MNRPALTLTQIDLDLAHWEATRARIQANLFELYEHATYRRLKGDPTQFPPQPPAPLSGDSARFLPPAVQRVGQLLQLSVEFSTVVDRSRELREHMPLVFRSEHMEKIHHLLHGPSVPVGDLITPLESRSLLANAVTEQNISLHQLVQIMEKDYDSSRNLILRVDNVWVHLKPLLAEFEKRIALLTQAATNLGTSSVPQPHHAVAPLVAECRLLIDRALAKMDTDPLCVPVDLEPRLGELITLAEERIRQSQSIRQSTLKTAADLNHALEELARYEQLVADSAQDCQAKTDIPLPPLPSTSMDLSQQSADLTQHIDAGRWSQAQAEFKRLGSEIQTLRAALDHRLQAARSALNLRLEWRGRFEAFQVKAQSLNLSSDPVLSSLQATALHLLCARPTPMSPARDAVLAYQRHLDDMIRKRSSTPTPE